jgi:hypothetical protein
VCVLLFFLLDDVWGCVGLILWSNPFFFFFWQEHC